MSTLILNPGIAEFGRSQTANTSPKEEKLNQIIAYNPKVTLTKSNLRHVMWKIAALVTIAAFAVIAVIAVVFTSISASLHLPIVTLAVLAGGLPLSSKAVTWMWTKGNVHRANAKFAASIQNKVDKMDDEAMYQNLKKYGVDISKISSKKIRSTPSLLKSAIARLNKRLHKADILQKGKFAKSTDILQHGKLVRKGELIRDGIDTLNEKIKKLEELTKGADYSEQDLNNLQSLRYIKDGLKGKRAFHRFKAARIVHLLQNPIINEKKPAINEKKPAGEPLTLSWQARVVAKANNDPHADDYLRIKGDITRIFTREKILSEDLVKLSKELFQV